MFKIMLPAAFRFSGAAGLQFPHGCTRVGIIG
jgi:hypothetical protein